jgi:hypothetical protein
MNDSFEQFRLQQKDYHLKQAQLLDSEELQKKIKDYFFWRDRLPVLKKEIEDILGKSMDDAAEPATSKRGPKQGGASISIKEVEDKLTAHLKGTTEGKSANEIANELHEDQLKHVPRSTIYQKVSTVLKRGEGDKFRKTGQLKNTEWFLIQK